MPTQINREKLIKAVDLTLDKKKAEWLDQRQRIRDAFAERKAEWVAEWNKKWEAAIPEIQGAIECGEPITKSMLPRDRHDVETYSDQNSIRFEGQYVSYPLDDAVYRPSRELLSLKNALLVIQDETVTPNALDALGVTKAALRDAVQALGALESLEAQKDKGEQA